MIKYLTREWRAGQTSAESSGSLSTPLRKSSIDPHFAGQVYRPGMTPSTSGGLPYTHVDDEAVSLEATRYCEGVQKVDGIVLTDVELRDSDGQQEQSGMGGDCGNKAYEGTATIRYLYKE